MNWLVSGAAVVVGALLIYLGRRGNRSRLAGVGDSGDMEVGLIDKWTVKHTDPESGVSWTFWWSVERDGFDNPVKVKVAETTYESHHPPAVVTLRVHPQTGRLYDKVLGRRVRFGFESIGWLAVSLGVGIGLSTVTSQPVWTGLVPIGGLAGLAFARSRAK